MIEAYERLILFALAAATLLNMLVCWTRWHHIRSSVDVCVFMICISNWVTALMSLCIGIRLATDNDRVAFASYWYTKAYEFLQITNYKWMVALFAILPLSNILEKSKFHTFLMCLAWLIVEIVLRAVIMVPGFMSSLQHYFGSILLGTSRSWLISVAAVEMLIYFYFMLVTCILLMVNCINYSNMKKGFVPSSTDKIKDTKTVIALASFYLVSIIIATPVLILIMLGVSWISSEAIPAISTILIICYGSVLFIVCLQCVLTPLLCLSLTYGWAVVRGPIQLVLSGYKRFKNDENISLEPIEKNDEESG